MQPGMTYSQYQQQRSQAPASAAPPRPMRPALPRPVSRYSDYPLAQFIRSSEVVRIYSQVLGVEVLLCGSEADVELWQMQHPIVNKFLTVYQGEELLELLGLPESGLRMIHEVKSVFGGRILSEGESAAPAASSKKSGTR